MDFKALAKEITESRKTLPEAGTMMSFTLNHRLSGGVKRKYGYAALYSQGFWFLTGAVDGKRQFSHEAFVALLREPRFTNIRIVTATLKVVS